jgi:hypothetical protein
MPILKRPLTFATPSLINDTDEARAKVERDYKEIVREAVRYLGAKRVKELNKEVAIARRGRKPNELLNKLVLARWDKAAVKDPTAFSKAFYKEYPQGHSARAVEKRLKPLLKARDRDRKLKAALQRPSLVGEWVGQNKSA